MNITVKATKLVCKLLEKTSSKVLYSKSSSKKTYSDKASSSKVIPYEAFSNKIVSNETSSTFLANHTHTISRELSESATSAFYVSIAVPGLARLILPQDDISYAYYCNNDGQIVERFSLTVQNIRTEYIVHILQIIIQENFVKLVINNEKPVTMHPWYYVWTLDTNYKGYEEKTKQNTETL
ncbi:DNA topoisomerase [Rhizophagus clarus]|uniref:DNA topoisomerase n=2 Tax=Rhizophagus clarus TaxID=94130 RepID=A0A8H3R010_9GLOM|nr:DNA topoisomerase [Rhizophagus clarus]